MNIHVIIKCMVLFYLTEHISFRKAIHTFTLNFFAGEGRFNSIKTFIFWKTILKNAILGLIWLFVKKNLNVCKQC